MAQYSFMGYCIRKCHFWVYGYNIQNGKLKILCLGRSKDIPFSEINKVEEKPNTMLSSFRRWYWGIIRVPREFSNRILGSYKAYSTHTKRTVVINANEQIVISPDNSEEFVDTLRQPIEE
ncbi:PH domain-containing protein [Gracilimonas sp. Q87]|uniref:PH domain-containing protein n=1 Tax=Gracilimonas sp. Q87 TaxID=3384766 RepID=UPI0039842910